MNMKSRIVPLLVACLAIAASASAQVTVQTVHTLTPAEGTNANHLIQGSDGALYGTASTGGSTDRGTLFRVAGDGTFTVVHTFGTAQDGANPQGVVQGLDGNFYVTTRFWLSDFNQLLNGALVRVTGSGAASVLFRQPTPLNVVAAAGDGALYGLGSGSGLVLYRSTTSGTATTTHTFANSLDLWYAFLVPRPFVEGPDHSLYGTTTGFFSASNPFKVPGTVFRLSPDRTSFTTLRTFDPAFNWPGPIAIGTDGNLYGTDPAGSFYRISTPGGATPGYTTLASLPFGTSTLVLAADGHFYAGSGGQIYRITAGGAKSSVYTFPSSSAFVTSLVAGADGNVYGTVDDGGTSSIFRFATPEVMTLDVPGNNTTAAQPFYAGGWAIDRASTSGPGVDTVHLWAFPAGGGAAVFLGAAEYFRPRGDVASIYGAEFTNSGYRLTVNGLAPGAYTFVAYAHSSLTGAFSQSRSSVVTVTNAVSQPAMNIDIPGPGATVPGSFQVEGWAIDRAALDGAGVDAIHVYAFGAGGSSMFLGVAAYGQPRTDVGTAYGAQFTNSGFSLTTSAPLAPGTYTLVVYARSTVSGTFFSQSRSLTVRAPGDPVMTIDTPSNGATVSQPFNLGGWAIDRDATSGAGVDAVHVWAYPKNGGSPIFAGIGQLNFARGDVGAAYGSQFTNSGYNVPVSGLPPGQYQIVVYAHSTVTGTFNQSRVVTVTITP
jgi:uncharacterized repeat protein (TIGR03803 family)